MELVVVSKWIYSWDCGLQATYSPDFHVFSHGPSILTSARPAQSYPFPGPCLSGASPQHGNKLGWGNLTCMRSLLLPQLYKAFYQFKSVITYNIT